MVGFLDSQEKDAARRNTLQRVFLPGLFPRNDGTAPRDFAMRRCGGGGRGLLAAGCLDAVVVFTRKCRADSLLARGFPWQRGSV